MSPFRLVYGKVCHLPVELEHKAYWAIQKLNFEDETCGERRLMDLNEMDELGIKPMLMLRCTKNIPSFGITSASWQEILSQGIMFYSQVKSR